MGAFFIALICGIFFLIKFSGEKLDSWSYSARWDAQANEFEQSKSEYKDVESYELSPFIIYRKHVFDTMKPIVPDLVEVYGQARYDKEIADFMQSDRDAIPYNDNGFWTATYMLFWASKGVIKFGPRAGHGEQLTITDKEDSKFDPKLAMQIEKRLQEYYPGYGFMFLPEPVSLNYKRIGYEDTDSMGELLFGKIVPPRNKYDILRWRLWGDEYRKEEVLESLGYTSNGYLIK